MSVGAESVAAGSGNKLAGGGSIRGAGSDGSERGAGDAGGAGGAGGVQAANASKQDADETRSASGFFIFKHRLE